MEYSIDQKFDSDFNKIENLMWLPFVGNTFTQSSKGSKLLIVGESHYLPDQKTSWYHSVKEMEFTRQFMLKQLINENNDMEKILLNLQRTFFINEPTVIQKLKFWNSLSYYNFIQRPLESISKKHRPLESDYIIGWNTFFPVVEILKPNFCLFCGKSFVTFNGAMIESMKRNNYDCIRHDDSFKSSGIKGVKIEFQKMDERIISLFILHPTSYMYSYKPSEWNDYIFKNFGNTISNPLSE
jgi:hypothetical protein